MSPPDPFRQTVRVEFNPNIQIIKLTQNGSPVLPLGRVSGITCVAACEPIFECQGLTDVECARKQNLSYENVGAELANWTTQLLTSLTDLDRQHVGIADNRNPVNAL